MIGGIVDRSVRKSRTLDLASSQGIRAVRLPIQEHIPNRQTHILNVDCVFSILCKYLECGDWSTTLREMVPIRKVTQGGKPQRQQNQRVAMETSESKVDEGVPPGIMESARDESPDTCEVLLDPPADEVKEEGSCR